MIETTPRDGSRATPSQDDMDRFRAAMERYAPIPDSEWEALLPSIRIVRLARGAHLVRQGSIGTSINVILEGMCRTYYLDDGRVRIRSFALEDQFISAYDSILTGRGALYNIEALEDTRLISFPSDLLPHLYERHACWERLGRRIAEQVWLVRERMTAAMRLSSPEERYRALLAEQPRFLHRVPLHQIASFIGVAPETLSRIRARTGSESP